MCLINHPLLINSQLLSFSFCFTSVKCFWSQSVSIESEQNYWVAQVHGVSYLSHWVPVRMRQERLDRRHDRTERHRDRRRRRSLFMIMMRRRDEEHECEAAKKETPKCPTRERRDEYREIERVIAAIGTTCDWVACDWVACD